MKTTKAELEKQLGKCNDALWAARRHRDVTQVGVRMIDMASVIQEWTTIPVSKTTAKKLRDRGKKGERYEEIILKLLGRKEPNPKDAKQTNTQ